MRCRYCWLNFTFPVILWPWLNLFEACSAHITSLSRMAEHSVFPASAVSAVYWIFSDSFIAFVLRTLREAGSLTWLSQASRDFTWAEKMERDEFWIADMMGLSVPLFDLYTVSHLYIETTNLQGFQWIWLIMWFGGVSVILQPGREVEGRER